jgi:hypothetical protein
VSQKISNRLFLVCDSKLDGYTPLEICNYKQMHINLICGNHSDIDIDSILVPTALFLFSCRIRSQVSGGGGGRHELQEKKATVVRLHIFDCVRRER